MTTQMDSVLAVGSKAPDFNNVIATGNRQISLKDYAGRYLIMVFYPKDQTPGCTRQLCALQDDFKMLADIDTDVIGVNPGSLESHERFAAAQGYQFPILVDADKSICDAYGALKPEGGIQRTVYIINPHGNIIFSQQGMPTDEEMADLIQQHRA